jgi:peptidoglycan hydrolase-like protein with peptidoglycan-binding domain
LHPTVARYKQIQEALASAGYYDGEIDGEWGPESVAALQRFQTNRGIANEGKITALALIGLGLGPKHQHMTLPVVSAGMSRPAVDSETATDRTRESNSLSSENAATANQ